MAESPKDPDQSMEDILQSIKRIIADEAEPAPDMPGSDVLELTELLEEDAAVPPSTIEEPAPVVPSVSLDDIMEAPVSSFAESQPQPAAHSEPHPEPVVSDAYEEPVPVMPPEPEPSKPSGDDRLMSDATLAASVAALHALSHNPQPLAGHGLSFRSGTTVEELVIEAIKPMLKDWLDSNLPAMVRSLVEKEIRRLSA